MAFKLDMTVDLYMAYSHVRVDDLDLETRSQRVAKGKQSSVVLSRQLSK